MRYNGPKLLQTKFQLGMIGEEYWAELLEVLFR